MEIIINDSKLVIEKRDGQVLTIETYSAEAAKEMALKIASEFING